MILTRVLSASFRTISADKVSFSAYFCTFGRSVAAANAIHRRFCNGNILPSGTKGLMSHSRLSMCAQNVHFLHSENAPLTYVSRAVKIDDIQMFGGVHGGVYLEITEEAGDMIVSQHYGRDNENSKIPMIPVLIKIEKSQFINTANLGENLIAEGEIIYTAPHSVRVLVSLYAVPHLGSGDRRLTLRSWLWYVLLNGNDHNKLLPVRPMQSKNSTLETEGKLEHERNKADRQRRTEVKCESDMEYSSTFSASSSHLIGREHSGWKAFSRAGPILKWMDELAGYVSNRFAATVCVTGLCDDISFLSKIVPGSFVTLTATPVFTSKSTVDIQCFADVETISDGHIVKERAVEAFFTFVALRKASKQDVTMKQLVPETNKEKAIYERRQRFYEERKQSSKNSLKVK